MESYHLDYKSFSTELCWIGRKYDTDKSSQRNDVSDHRHCHPYTIFYNTLFKSKRETPIVIAELGILYGASLLMWAEYFPNARIHGFDYNTELINEFKQSPNNNFDRVSVAHMNIKDPLSIVNGFADTNTMFDVIIDDTTHEFEDQINIIKYARSFLKPGGVLIIEDIFKHHSEINYRERLVDVLPAFQSSFFVSLDHVRRNSVGWDNDKLLVLVKNGAPPIFPGHISHVTLITPVYLKANKTRKRSGQ